MDNNKCWKLEEIMGYTKVEGDHLDLSGRKYQNDTYDKINRIL